MVRSFNSIIQYRNGHAGYRVMKKIYDDNQGFTLLEVIIAVSILAIGILAMGVLQTSSISLNTNARGITEASTWATDRMELLMALPYDAPTPHDLTNGSHSGPTIDGYTINWNVVDDGTNNFKTITITVTWSNLGSSGGQKSVVFESVKAQLI